MGPDAGGPIAAVMFADVCGSTKLYETLGDARARKIIAHCVNIMTDVTGRFGGTVIKTIGDEVMTIFPSGAVAASAACDMQESITGEMLVDGKPVAIRIGFHFGPVIEEAGDVFGDTVNVAARMAGIAKAGQIILSDSTVASLTPDQRAAVRQVDEAEVKGKQQPIPVFELVHRPEEATMIQTQTAWAKPAASSNRLLITAGGTCLELSARQPSLTFGRGNDNDIVMNKPLVSRLHARLEFKRGRFLLTDLSSNGTFVAPDDGTSHFLCRDTYELAGSGRLGLGEAASKDSGNVVRYVAD